MPLAKLPKTLQYKYIYKKQLSDYLENTIGLAS